MLAHRSMVRRIKNHTVYVYVDENDQTYS